MLRINLLPIRKLKKRKKAHNQLLSFFTLFSILLLILGAVGFLQNAKISSIQESIARLQKEKQTYAPILAEMKRLEQAKQDLENKINVIKTLKKNSAITVRILDEVAKTVDTKRMWLETLKQQGQSLSLKGTALDNRSIAQFMDALKESPYVSSVNLSDASLKTVSGRNLKSFSLGCTTITPDEKVTETAK